MLEPHAHLQAISIPRMMSVIAHAVVGQARGYCIPREDLYLLSREQQAKNILTRTQRGVERTGKAAVEDLRKATTKLIRMMSCCLVLWQKLLDDINAAIFHSGRRGTVHHELLLGCRARCRQGHRNKERHPSHRYCIGLRWTTGLCLAPHEPSLQERRQEMKPTTTTYPALACLIR
jgi:hypothetical protein